MFRELSETRRKKSSLLIASDVGGRVDEDLSKCSLESRVWSGNGLLDGWRGEEEKDTLKP